MSKTIGIIGAGPGGLTAAMILAHRGFDVTVFERKDTVGGRNAAIHLGPYVFDTGPTFLMMRYILDEVFDEAGSKSEDHLEFTSLDPMYRLQFGDRILMTSPDAAKVNAEIDAVFPGNAGCFDTYMAKERERLNTMLPCLQMPYDKFTQLLHPNTLKVMKYALSRKSVMDVLLNYFNGTEELALAFSFQSKYLGMSPWDCPGFFAMLGFIEYEYGVEHTTGGLSRISDVMAEVAEKNGATIRLNTEVKSILTPNGKATGVELADGEKVAFDEVVINADFAYAMNNLVEPGILKKYSSKALDKKRYSCSTFMLYLGLDTLYEDLPHHTIAFADSYKKNVSDIFENRQLSDDFSFYVRNASITDKTLAPDGHSGLYVLVPMANLRADVDWDAEREPFRDRVLDAMEKRLKLKDLRSHIVQEHVIAPPDWRDSYNVHLGATFNLAHNTMQMLYFRPHNRFEEIDNCFLVGGGTHPGSGLPTIYESGRITANLISRKHGVEFKSHNAMA